MPLNQIEQKSIVRGVVQSADPDGLVLSIPHSDYQLHLVTPDGVQASKGQRLKGTIEATALKIHSAQGGGRFIEPIYGAPRIVAGCVQFADEETRRVLVDVGVPMWVNVPADQDLSLCLPGSLVNFYVASGTSFTPIQD